MSNSTARTPTLFSLGVLLLEASGSVLHTQILQDVPPELGLTLPAMILRDLSLAVVAGVVFFVSARILRKEQILREAPRWGAVTTGASFALVLEAFNWILPNSLLTPATAGQGMVAWTYFVACAAGAAALLASIQRRPRRV